jgi:hypothetical protein
MTPGTVKLKRWKNQADQYQRNNMKKFIKTALLDVKERTEPQENSN